MREEQPIQRKTTIMEEFKRIEDYPVVNDGTTTEEWMEKLSQYDDYLKECESKSRRNAIEAWKKTKDIILD